MWRLLRTTPSSLAARSFSWTAQTHVSPYAFTTRLSSVSTVLPPPSSPLCRTLSSSSSTLRKFDHRTISACGLTSRSSPSAAPHQWTTPHAEQQRCLSSTWSPASQHNGDHHTRGGHRALKVVLATAASVALGLGVLSLLHNQPLLRDVHAAETTESESSAEPPVASSPSFSTVSSAFPPGVQQFYSPKEAAQLNPDDRLRLQSPTSFDHVLIGDPRVCLEALSSIRAMQPNAVVLILSHDPTFAANKWVIDEDPLRIDETTDAPLYYEIKETLEKKRKREEAQDREAQALGKALQNLPKEDLEAFVSSVPKASTLFGLNTPPVAEQSSTTSSSTSQNTVKPKTLTFVTSSHYMIMLDPDGHAIGLGDGTKIRYGKLLLAKPCSEISGFYEFDGSVPHLLELNSRADIRDTDWSRLPTDPRHLSFVGHGSLATTELAYRLKTDSASDNKDMDILMVTPTGQLLAHILPDYLSEHITRKMREFGITIQRGLVYPARDADEQVVQLEGGRLVYDIFTEDGATDRVETESVFVVGGSQADAWWPVKTKLEKTEKESYLVADAELRASHSDIFLAGDSVSYYDETLGRVRIDPEVARKSGRVAGFNMAGGKATFTGFTELRSELPGYKLTALGRCESELRTVAVWERPEGLGKETTDDTIAAELSDEEKYRRGIIYYITKTGHVCGVLFCNVENRTEVARAFLIKAAGRVYSDDPSSVTAQQAYHTDELVNAISFEEPPEPWTPENSRVAVVEPSVQGTRTPKKD